MKNIDEIGKETAEAFGIRSKHQRRIGVVFDVLQAVFFFWKWFKDDKRKENLDDRGDRFGGDACGSDD